MFKKIVIGFVFIVGVLVVIIANRPSEFRVSRSVVMSAPASVVFDQVNDLHKWKAWSPWAKMDPSATEAYAGPVSGTGAVMSWVGNMKVGAGSMTIIESHPNTLIRFRLDFVKPLPGTNTAEFSFIPQGHQTQVTWSMYGHNNFISKAMGLVMDCDKMVGGQFEKGLESLKSIVETPKRS